MRCKQSCCLVVACALVACRSYDDGSHVDYFSRRDSGVHCPGGSTGTAFELPGGSYTGKISANDTDSCGMKSSGGSSEELLEVVVTEGTVTIAPGEPMQVSMVRAGNKLCGTSQREFRLTLESNLCILDELDRINGEVSAPGEFWVDLDFDWKRKGGVCNGLNLPCAGRTTWSFRSKDFPLAEGEYEGKITRVKENTCNASGIGEGVIYFVQISKTSSSLSYCLQTTNKCLTFVREGNHLSYSGPFDSWIPKCDGSETISGEITSATTLILTRTLATLPSCSMSCRIVYDEEVQAR